MTRVALVMLMLSVGTADLSAQIRTRNSADARALREAAALESRGDYDGAETILRRLLESSPTSSGGLFALERVLTAQGNVTAILPVVDAYLAAAPEESGVRSLKLRVLADADSLDAVREEAEAWLAADASNPLAYREVGGVYARAFGTDAALVVLREGRARIGEPDALSLEIGDLLAARGDLRGTGDEWALAIGNDAGQVATVTRRIQGLGDSEAETVGRRVVEILGASDVLDRRRAGARIAIDLALRVQALPLVRAVADDLRGRERDTFLNDSARRARDNGLIDVAAWAYDELGEEAGSPAERRQFDQRIVDVALASGDTASALEAQRRVAESFSPGSVDRRRATAQVIRIEGTQAAPEDVQMLLADFRQEFPNAPELDDLAASVAGAFQARGDLEGAATVLEGVDGPKSSLERAYLLLGAGQIEEGRSALLLALTGLPPAEATSVIQFAGLLGRSSPAGTEALAAAGVAAHRGRPGEAAAGLAEATGSLEEGERAALLAEAARLADGGGESALAASIRARILDEHPTSSEVADASLALARYHARTPRGLEEAIRLLEELIVERPNAAVVPDARIELERLRGRGER